MAMSSSQESLMTNVILYLPGVSSSSGNHLMKILVRRVNDSNLKICGCIDTLKKTLGDPLERFGVAVLWAASREELRTFEGMQCFLDDLSLIVILPDRTRGAAEEAYKLYPRFLCYQDGDLRQVGSVVSKMLKRNSRSD